MKKDLISLDDLNSQQMNDLFNLTDELKKHPDQNKQPLKGKSVGLLFQKPSNRTRVSFEVGTWQLGGNCIYLGPTEINLGKRETTEDVAKTLSRYLDGIVARTFDNQDIVDLGKAATIPIINGLSDLYHPCQALTDIFSIREKFSQLKDINVAYIGDGNNVCHSLILGCAKMGINIKVATPPGYEPDENIVDRAQTYAKANGSQIVITSSPEEAISQAHVIYSDVWVSMGQEEETKKRLDTFKKYQVNAQLTKLAQTNYIFMHCLPAHRGQEVTADIIDGPHSIVFDQAENRMHVQKSILIFLLRTDIC